MPSSFWFEIHETPEHLGSQHAMWSPSHMLPDGDKIENIELVGLYLAANKYEVSIDSTAVSFKGCPAADGLGKSTTTSTMLDRY